MDAPQGEKYTVYRLNGYAHIGGVGRKGLAGRGVVDADDGDIW